MRAPLTYEIARTAAEAVIEKARSEGLKVAVAVVDRGGMTRIHLADDLVGAMGVETARRKAYTSAVTGMPTEMFTKFVSHPDMQVSPPQAIDPQLLPAPGGQPIVVDGVEVIGGIGVGGADGATDDRLAAEAIAAIQSLLA